MGNLGRAAVVVLSVVILAACAQDLYSGLDAPEKFFAKHKIGSSPDYAIIKFNNIKDHVITVHGFADDSASCTEVADALNAAACKEITDGSACLNPYSCQVLNR